MRRVGICSGQVVDKSSRDIFIEEALQRRLQSLPGRETTRQPSLAIRCKCQTSTNIVPRELREIGEDVVLGHSSR
jgi:hypothetical protein